MLPVAGRGLAHCDEYPGCEAFPPGLLPDFECRGSASLEPWEGKIDWDAWRHIFVDRPTSMWSDGPGAMYLMAYMDSDVEAMHRHWSECPLGVLNADMLLYTIAVYQGEFATASAYKQSVERGLRSLPVRVLLGSTWPLFSIFTSEKLREIRSDVADDAARNCVDLERPALNWGKFQSSFYGEERKDWYENTIKYVLSWQMLQIPELLAEECPLGVLTIHAIRAFTCATSESSCFAASIQQVEAWMAEEPNLVEVLAHSRWPIAVVLNHMSHATRHPYKLDFKEAELVGSSRVLEGLPPNGLPAQALLQAADAASSVEQSFPQGLHGLGSWISSSAAGGWSQSFRDAIALLPRLGPGPAEAPSLVYISMVYGARFNKHIRRFCARVRALGLGGERLILYTLDSEAYDLCQVENGQRCMRGMPNIVNKFTMPLICAHLGLDAVWIDFDVFLMQDPTPPIVQHADSGPFDILISGSFESDCICNGIVYFRSTDAVRTWLLAVVLWMYHHPYEHDQKTFSAFLNYTESVQQAPLDLPAIPPWDTLDPINGFVTPDTFEGNGWSGDLDKIVIYHFLNGESDTGSGLDPSGTWMREHGNFNDDGGGPPPCLKPGGKDCKGYKISLMDLFYSQDDEDLYATPKPPYENPAIRRALLASRKAVRRTDLLGKPCGPMVGVVGTPPAAPTPGAPSPAELLQLAREGRKPPQLPQG